MPELEVLPECRWRGKPLRTGVYDCHSPKLYVKGGVTAKLCGGCYCCNHPVPDPNQPPRIVPVRTPNLADGRPGHHLKQVLQELGQTGKSGCQCEARANQMNAWGLEGCRRHRDEIIGWLRAEWASLGWGGRTLAVLRGLWAGHLNVADPFGAVFDECLRRAAGEVGEREGTPMAAVDEIGPVVPFVPGTGKRHVLFHVMPVAGTPAWRINCDNLLARIDAFTGQRICAINTTSARCKRPLDPPEAVREYLASHNFDFVEVPNDYRMREVATWNPMWERLRMDEADLVFYCHAKGVTKPWNAGVTCHTWGRVMFAWLLDYLPEIEELLTQFPVVGIMPKLGQHFAGSACRFHYSGSFYWVRAAEVIRRKAVDKIDRTWFGVETWPGCVFLADEMGCPHDPQLTAEIDPYQMATWRERLLPMFAKWVEDHPRGLVHGTVPALDSRWGL